MKTRIQALILAASMLAVNPLHAQLVADGATNTHANVPNDFTDEVKVGMARDFSLREHQNHS